MLLSQYALSPNLRKYISIFLEESAEVKKAMTDSIKYRYLADSFGIMVDDLAYLVGASRVIHGAQHLGTLASMPTQVRSLLVMTITQMLVVF